MGEYMKFLMNLQEIGRCILFSQAFLTATKTELHFMRCQEDVDGQFSSCVHGDSGGKKELYCTILRVDKHILCCLLLKGYF